MSNTVLDRPTFEAIEDYVLDRMSAEERMAFEQRMAQEPSLREELALERENILAVELGGVTRMLKAVGAEQIADQERTTSGNGWKRYVKYAAMLAVVLTAGLWMMRPSANERLFAEHFNADPGLPVPMGASDNLVFHDAMVAYKLGDYAEARSKWAPLLEAEPMNDTLRFYMASAFLAEGNTKEAISNYEGLAADPASEFHTRAQWYLLLAYLRTGQSEKLSAIPLDDDPLYGERVRAIKSGLKH
ncbi:MAG: hypothetical protein IPM46_01355 [Flavobacteriales bacterium]|nr:hypothetical protein [Flavobacteriales bacterium]